MVEPQQFFIHRIFDDFDELTEEARHWDLDFRQLENGNFRGRLLQFSTNQTVLAHARFNRTLLQQGTPPAGMRTFAIPSRRHRCFQWRRHTISDNDVLIFPAGGELHSISRADFEIFTYSFTEEQLEQICRELEIPEFLESLNGAEVVTCPPVQIAHVRAKLSRLCNFVEAYPDRLSCSFVRYEMEHELLGDLVKLIAASRSSSKCDAPGRRKRAIKQVEDYVFQHSNQPVMVDELCQAAQVSERTLEYAFREHYGMTPKAFVKAIRLNGVRRELRSQICKLKKINDIAGQWGFWHMGQFAADYRRLFSELPSATLRRRRSGG